MEVWQLPTRSTIADTTWEAVQLCTLGLSRLGLQPLHDGERILGTDLSSGVPNRGIRALPSGFRRRSAARGRALRVVQSRDGGTGLGKDAGRIPGRTTASDRVMFASDRMMSRKMPLSGTSTQCTSIRSQGVPRHQPVHRGGAAYHPEIRRIPIGVVRAGN